LIRRRSHGALGVELAPANQVTGTGDQGVVIVNVDPNGMAAGNGLSSGDVILNVSGKTVSQPD
jgi:serine protease Do